MSTWAIGDIQGCWASLETLLTRIDFRPSQDRLWLVGDLVNRGPRSLDVLRWAMKHDESITIVLGNHDLHLLAVAEGIAPQSPDDTLNEILCAPDRDELMHWLRHRPVLHKDGDHLLVHAGVPPSWSTSEAMHRARDIERHLRSSEYRAFLAAYRTPRDAHNPTLTPQAQDLMALTRMRMWSAARGPDFEWKGSPKGSPDDRIPWFKAPGIAREETIVFGHWAALGLHRAQGFVALDSGCVWGRSLTAWCLDTDEMVSVPSAESTAGNP